MFDTRNFDAKRLIDQFLSPQPEAPPPARGAGFGTRPPPPAQSTNPLDEMLGKLSSLGGFGAGRPGEDREAGMIDRARQMLGGSGGSLAAGGAAGALVSMVLGSKGGRKMAKNAVALGGLALVGTLAYKAYQNYRNGEDPQQTGADVARNPAPTPAQLPPPNSPFNPTQVAESGLPLTLLRTMIAAALSDGHIDETERVAIAAKLREAGIADLGESEAFLAEELANPATVETLARGVATEEAAAEVYMAALLAIDPDSSAERAFLARLALALRLDPALTPHLESAARAARV